MTQYLPHLHQGHEHHQHDHVSAAGATRIDCDTCAVRGPACNDCVISVLLGPPPELAFDDEERRALDVLAAGDWCRRCGWSPRWRNPSSTQPEPGPPCM